MELHFQRMVEITVSSLLIVVIEKNVAVHNDLMNIEFHLIPVEGSTVNIISIAIRGRNVQWYVNNTIALVIIKHVISSIQTCSRCQNYNL